MKSNFQLLREILIIIANKLWIKKHWKIVRDIDSVCNKVPIDREKSIFLFEWNDSILIYQTSIQTLISHSFLHISRFRVLRIQSCFAYFKLSVCTWIQFSLFLGRIVNFEKKKQWIKNDFKYEIHVRKTIFEIFATVETIWH